MIAVSDVHLTGRNVKVQMCSSVRRLVLLPGLDGTGKLFADFSAATANRFMTEVVRYPTDRFMSYPELLSIVDSVCSSEEPFVLVAESFSTPLAIRYAATRPPNLKGLVICAGFASSPLQGWLRFASVPLLPLLFRVSPPPTFALRSFLVGRTAPWPLVKAVRNAISSVKRTVLQARVQAVLACDVRADLARVDVPVIYIRATHDRLVNYTCFEEIQEIKPDTKLAAVCGPHLIVQREPRQTAEIIAQFVQQLA